MSTVPRRLPGPHRLARAIVGVLLVLLPLTACVQIPTDSAVTEGRAGGVESDPPQFYEVPDGPSPGASREEIVVGYLVAMLAYPQSPDVVREFMAPDAAAKWDPAAGLVVYDDLQSVEGPRGIALSATKLGALDERGSWTSAEPTAKRMARTIRLTKVKGQWRIVNPPQGTYVDGDYFARNYDQYSMFFFDPTGTVLVPDPIYLLKGDGTATALVRNLLSGPTTGLAGVVSTTVTPSVEVDTSVSVSDSGTAEVPLTEEVLGLSGADRQLLAAQIGWTLAGVVGIADVKITVAGQPMDIPGVGETFRTDEFLFYDPAGLAANRQLFALSPRGLVSVSNDQAAGVLGPIGNAQVQARAAAVDPSGALAALVSQDGHSVVVGGVAETSTGPAKTWFDSGTDVLRPSWDTHGVLWLVDRTSSGAVVHALSRTGDGIHDAVIDVPGVTGEDVRAIAVSRDGVRLAAVVGQGQDSRLMISVIDRSPNHIAQVQLSPAREVVNPDYSLENMSGLAWVSPTSVVVLAEDEGGDAKPYLIDIDGSEIEPTIGFLPVQPATVAAGPNIDAPIVIGTRSGELYGQTADMQWELISSGKLFAPVYPG